MQEIIIKEGVVAEMNGQYWGIEHESSGHGGGTSYAFGPIEKAIVKNFNCDKATDMVGDLYYKQQLKDARLLLIKITTIYDIGDCGNESFD